MVTRIPRALRHCLLVSGIVASGIPIHRIRAAEDVNPEPARAARRLIEGVRKHPVQHNHGAGDRLQLYVMDLESGERLLLADEPAPGLDCIGSPSWSNDGTRIVFDASAARRFNQARLMVLTHRDDEPVLTDLGFGCRPTFSPDARRIGFTCRKNVPPGAEAGIWVMNDDGTGRVRLVDYGAPYWSPDGRGFMIYRDNSRASIDVQMINIATMKAATVSLEDQSIFSWPRWAGPDIIVACLGQNPPTVERIALLDVSDPARVMIKETLWRRTPALDVVALWPIYHSGTGRCVFVGIEGRKRRLYQVFRGRPNEAKALEDGPHEDRLGGTAFSPDGRYLLFTGNRPDFGR